MVSSTVEVSMNKITPWISVGVNHWTANEATIASDGANLTCAS